ncbi:protein MIGRI [Wielerella bovis]|uniref:protein MIGRI n=1 Tax=Wielerella bovis TaxID=2917790 RepID=UPI002018B765|nr:hypothetical protein [Wielerella bovis]ULJ65068.1 hypothetical protein MIS33_01875 [Wielerella bovis]ULJ67341.1 hypothetical protein MIS31_01880 [Wielerella bovis]
MLTRYFTVIGILLLLALMVRILLNRPQKQVLHQFVSVFAIILLLISLLYALIILLNEL